MTKENGAERQKEEKGKKKGKFINTVENLDFFVRKGKNTSNILKVS